MNCKEKWSNESFQSPGQKGQNIPSLQAYDSDLKLKMTCQSLHGSLRKVKWRTEKFLDFDSPPSVFQKKKWSNWHFSLLYVVEIRYSWKTFAVLGNFQRHKLQKQTFYSFCWYFLVFRYLHYCFNDQVHICCRGRSLWTSREQWKKNIFFLIQ